MRARNLGELAMALALASSCQTLLDDRPLPAPAGIESPDGSGPPASDGAGVPPASEGETGAPGDEPPRAPEGVGPTVLDPAGPASPADGGASNPEGSPPALDAGSGAPSPPREPARGEVVQLVAGNAHTCALLDTGAVRCWGDGLEGALGYGNSGPFDEQVNTGIDIGDDESPAAAGYVDLGGRARQLASNGLTTCAVLDDDGVRCWGSLAFRHRLEVDRVGDDESPATAGAVDFGGPVRSVAVGKSHVCALLASGAVRCWGLPDGVPFEADIDGTVPVPPPTLREVRVGGAVEQLTAADGMTCALLASGAVRCWGNGLPGALGHGSSEDIETDAEIEAAGDVPIGDAVRQIDPGGSGTCALLVTGAVRCWGHGSEGALGYGNTETIGDDEAPFAAGDVPIGGRVVQLGVGSYHACAILETGALRCWGGNWAGQLGYGHTETIGDDETPELAGDVPLGGRAIGMSLGASHTCVLLEAGGVRCFGAGDAGQLGYGDTVTVGDDETPEAAGFVDIAGEPVIPSEPRGVITLASGSSHNCALLDTHQVRCWGAGYRGQLGHGDRDNVGDDEPPASRPVVPLRGSVRQVATGGLHSCALLESGALRCWGAGSSGQLGYGNTRDIGDDEPADAAGFVRVGGNVRQVVLGQQHTCALLESDEVRCWGSFYLQESESPELVGDDEFPDSRPALALGGPVRELAAGASHTCALLESGEVRCWGIVRHIFGYRDPAARTDAGADALPALLDLGGPVHQVTTGAGQTCALLESGDVDCYGYEGLAAGVRPVPLRLDLGGAASQLALGEYHGCAQLLDGGVRCWRPYLDRSDSTSLSDPDSAPLVPLGGPSAQLVAGDRHACALLASGGVRCWGEPDFGQLGYGSLETIGDDESPESMGDVRLF